MTEKVTSVVLPKEVKKNGSTFVAKKTIPINKLPFTSIIAHEIKNPLTNINLSVEMLRNAATEADQQLYLEMILKNSKRINRLINLLLSSDLAKIKTEETTTIPQLLEEILAINNDEIVQKNIKIYKKFSKKLYNIKNDESKIKIAISNIIINALDALPSINGTLTFSTKWLKGNYSLSIEDNGCGINADNIEHIFTPHHTNKPNGLGMGLAYSHDIFQNNNVAIKMSSTIPNGTTCTLTFQ